MKKLNLVKTILTMLLFTVTGANAQDNISNLWVTFNDAAEVPVLENGRLISTNNQIQDLIDQYHIINVEQALPSSRRDALQKVYEVQCNCNGDALIKEMGVIGSLTEPARAPEYELLNTPNDYSTEFTTDYALDLINAKDAWNYSIGDANTILGISDSGFNPAHEELVTKISSIDNQAINTTSYSYHGTAVAITAGGATNNTVGKSSIGYNCKVALSTIGYNQLLDLSYNGARVINVSWYSGCYYSTYIQEVIDEVYDNNTIVVAAAGNGGTCGGPENLVYPASLDHVISVSSVGPKDNHERSIGDPNSTHQHNEYVDICAPGYDVALTVSPGWYLTGNGTSFAAPYVTGTIGLMLSIKPCLSFEDVESILKRTAVNLDANNPQYAGKLGAGRMNAGAALMYTSMQVCHGNGQGDIVHGNPHALDGDDGNNGHGNDDGNFDPSNPGSGHGHNGQGHNSGHGTIEAPVVPGNNHGGGRYGEESTETETKEINAKAFPNPTTDRTTITWNSEENVEITVLDMSGKIIEQRQVPSGTNRLSVELNESGVYLVQINTNGTALWTERVIKM